MARIRITMFAVCIPRDWNKVNGDGYAMRFGAVVFMNGFAQGACPRQAGLPFLEASVKPLSPSPQAPSR